MIKKPHSWFYTVFCVLEIDLSFREKPYKCKRDWLPPTKLSTVGMNRKQEELSSGAFWTKQMTAKQSTNKRLKACDLVLCYCIVFHSHRCCILHPRSHRKEGGLQCRGQEGRRMRGINETTSLVLVHRLFSFKLSIVSLKMLHIYMHKCNDKWGTQSLPMEFFKRCYWELWQNNLNDYLLAFFFSKLRFPRMNYNL